jgi:hypothetical protein
MFRDFSTEMLARYGAGLEGLFDRHLADPEEGTPRAIGESGTAEPGSRRLA